MIEIPMSIINSMLSELNFSSDNIIDKKILIPQSQSLELILEVYNRLIEVSIDNKKDISEQLKNIYLYTDNYNEVKNNIDILLANYKLKNVQLNIFNESFLNNSLDITFDFIIAIPEFKKSQNIINDTNIKSDIGMIIFNNSYSLLDKQGKASILLSLSSITNNDTLSFRNTLINDKVVQKIINYKDELFDYTKKYNRSNILVIVNKNHNNTKIIYQENSLKEMLLGYNVDLDKYLNKPWQILDNNKDEINSHIESKTKKLGDICEVYYKIHTGCNSVYIGNVQIDNDEHVCFNMKKIEKELLKPISSIKDLQKEKQKMVIFPYVKKEGKYSLISENDLKTQYPLTYKYLLNNKKTLNDRNVQSKSSWFKYARVVYPASLEKDFLIFNSNVEEKQKTLNVQKVTKGMLISSGYYVCAKDEKNLELIKKILESEEFMQYIQINAKYNSKYKLITADLIKNYKYD